MKLKLYGPPGTGKTTTITRIARRAVEERSVKADKIKALSFTRAAKWGLLEKAPFLQEENVRTLHSFVWKACGLSKDNILSKVELKGFFEQLGFEFQVNDYEEDEEDFLAGMDDTRVVGNWLYALINGAKHRYGLNYADRIYDLYQRLDAPIHLTERALRDICLTFEDYMERNERYDYTHGLLLGLKKEGSLDEFSGDMLILDEFQDITPLSATIIRRVEGNFKNVIIAGDDDQAIFTFAGANPHFLIRWGVDEERVLEQSYRLPVTIWELANRVIEKNRERKQKLYRPNGNRGRITYGDLQFIERLMGELEKSGRSVLILARNRFLLNDYMNMLRDGDIPFTGLRHRVRVPEWVKVADVVERWRKGEASEGEVKGLVGRDDDVFSMRKVAGYTYSKAKEWEKVRDMILNAMLRRDRTIPVVKKLMDNPFFWVKVSNRRDVWLQRLPKLKEWLRPKIRIGTIHQAKGLEADVVLLDTGMGWKTYREAEISPEAERRVLYTGITRAKEWLILVEGRDTPSYGGLGWL